MKFVFIISASFLLFLTISSCRMDNEGLQKLPYDSVGILRMKDKIIQLNLISYRLKKKLMHQHIGFVIADGKVMFKNCEGVDGYYMDSSQCNLDPYLNKEEKIRLKEIVSYVSKNQIAGSVFLQTIESNFLVLDYSSGNGINDALYLGVTDSVITEKRIKIYFEIIDKNNGLYLLRWNERS